MISAFNHFFKQTFEPIYLPCHLHRQIENDLPAEQDNLAQRVYKIIMPLLMLYRPIAKPLSIGMGTLRVITHLDGCNQARQQGDSWTLLGETTQTGLAAISLASSFSYLSVSVFLTTFADIAINLGRMMDCYQKQNADRFTEELVQLMGNSFYMAYMVYSSSYTLIASIVAHGLINLYQARKAWNEGKRPEAFSQFIVASFRCLEARHRWNIIRQQNAFIAQQEAEGKELLNKLSELKAKVEAQNKLPAIQTESKSPVATNKQNVLLPRGILKTVFDHPLAGGFRTIAGLGLSIYTLNNAPLDPRLQMLFNTINDKKINQRLRSFPLQNFQDVTRAVKAENTNEEHDFGTHLHGYGKTLVKGFNLCFKDKTQENDELIELDFKINHFFRGQLEKSISSFSNRNTRLQMKALSYLTDSSIGNVRVNEGQFEMGGFGQQKAHRIDFEGGGTILVGNNPDIAGMYNRVFVRIPKQCSLFQLYEMLSFVGLENTLRRFTHVDLERLKIGYLFRHYYPEQATLFERTSQFFKLSIDQLKAAIIEQVPEMKDLFLQYLPKFRPYEILPGRIRYGIEGVGRKCYELGARSLICSMRFIFSDEKEPLNRVVSIIQTGMLSSELRFGNEINSVGMSPNSDLRHGSADNVFAQLATINDYQDNEAPAMGKFDYFNPYLNIAFEFDLDALDTLSYQYHTDEYGTRNLVNKTSIYLGRPNLYDFVVEEVNGYHKRHEVMIRDRIPPSLIRGILVANNEFKEHLYQHLKEVGLIQSNPDGIEVILGIPVTQFIRSVR